MDLFSFNTIILILFYVPGYIFIHTVDYFLLKREKTQFEITIQGLLVSVCLLIFFVICAFRELQRCHALEFFEHGGEVVRIGKAALRSN